jgi:hypothetical protein
MLFWDQMSRRRAAPSAIAALALLAGCYATTPHRAEVTAAEERATCNGAVGDVMTRAGLVPLTPPPRYSMLFGPRVTGQGLSYNKAPARGIGVVIRETSGEAGPHGCSVTLEAVSTDASCPAASEPIECEGAYAAAPSAPPPPYAATWSSPAGCNLGPRTCEMAPVPGHDSTVDDLARRVRDALGPGARVAMRTD